jgi:SAM-dependent methyltransferase
MDLTDIVRRALPPEPWGEGDNIPWNEPGFSGRMLSEHLAESHDRASRRPAVVDRHVRWIHEAVLHEHPSRILDLCCGPGLYTSRLAALGHACRGIDYSPASIEYARNEARDTRSVCEYELSDVRSADFGGGFDLVMMIFGEFNVFRTGEAADILRRAHAALVPGGALLLEPHTLEAVRDIGNELPTWFASESGLFSESPHVVLRESHWDPRSRTATVRHFVVEEGGRVSRLSVTYQGYSHDGYAELLDRAGFDCGHFMDSLAGSRDDSQVELCALLAHKE